MSAPVSSAPLFSLVQPAQVDALERLFHPAMLEPGQVLFEEGKPCDWLWVLGEGVHVDVTSAGDAPGEVVVADLRGGDTVGEMALVDEGPRSGTARVVTGGPAAVMAARDFYALRDAYHPAAFQLLRKICLELCRRLRDTSDRLVPPAPPIGLPTLPFLAERTAAEQLDDVAAFRQLPRVVKLALAQKLGRLDLPDAAMVCIEGETADAAYFIATGSVQVMRSGRALAQLGPGEVFGMVALIDGGRRSATCVTAGDTRLFRLARHDFDQLFSSGNRFAFGLVDGMARQLVRHLRSADQLLTGPEAAVAPSPLVPSVLFSEAELGSLELGGLRESLGAARIG